MFFKFVSGMRTAPGEMAHECAAVLREERDRR